MKKIIIASTSTLYNGGYLAYLKEELKCHFAGVEHLIFIPYARPGGISHDEYTAKVSVFFNELGIKVRGLHEFKDPIAAIEQAEAIFTGGGNTFVLVSMLYKYDLWEAIEKAVCRGVPYLGTGAGSN